LLKRIFDVKRVITKTSTGTYWIDPASNLGIALISQGSYEPNMQKTLETLLAPGKVFVDVGANEGYFTIQGALLTDPGGRVLCIEPQNRLIPIIEQNLRLNGIDNVNIVQAAISDKTGMAMMHLTPDTNSGGSSLYRPTKYRLAQQNVKVFTLADVLLDAGFDCVDLMKIDIEGFEYEAILGSPKIFESKRVKALALELHPTALASRGKSVRDIELFLQNVGYVLAKPFGNAIWLAKD
jgi:FkbM family methyltransferase